ncbi:M16 family metallopeptidase [Alkalibacillus aidingensis]|uniref:M16 family metallopeptidase n=1 Tax=Alkalibacillus aidingensis TaxID=2747607 RepID=UPI0016609099|nr:pitrilysin family protein [Alkalibacillus aidingensis]
MINKYTLNNGLRVVEEQLSAVRSVSIGIWILTGSRNEPKSLNGISHLIEHMLFKGTKNRSAKEIAEAFDSIGGHINAFTSKEYTCLYAKVIDEHIETAVSILSDMINHSLFDEEELEREKKVVLEEILMTEDTPDDIIHDYLHEVSFKGHPLAQPILGNKETLNNFSRADLLAYVDRYYTSDRMVISVAGNVPSNFNEIVSEQFGSIRPSRNQQDYFTKTFTVDSLVKQDDIKQAHLCLGYNGVPVGDESVYTLSVLNNVLGGSMSSRLFQQIREEKGLSYATFSYHNTFRDNGILTIYSATAHEQLDEMESIIYNIVNDIKANGITDSELQNTIQQLKGQLVLGLENPSSRMSRNGRNELLDQPHRTIDELMLKLEEVDHDAIHDLTSQLFDHDPARALILPESI